MQRHRPRRSRCRRFRKRRGGPGPRTAAAMASAAEWRSVRECGERRLSQCDAHLHLRLGRPGEIVEQCSAVALVALDERVQEVGHGSTKVIALPACTSTRSPGCTGPTSVVSTVSTPNAVRTADGRPASNGADHLGQPALVRASDADGRLSRGIEQTRMREADVREFPEDVIAADEPPVVTSALVIVRPTGGDPRRHLHFDDPSPSRGSEAPTLRLDATCRRPARRHRRRRAMHRRRVRRPGVRPIASWSPSATAGRARVPTMTGWTNSTATCCAW